MKILTHIINKGQSIAPEGRLLIKVALLCLIVLMVFPALVKKALISDLRPLTRVWTMPYGPSLHLFTNRNSSYNFFPVRNSFGNINLARVKEIHKHNLEDLILSTLDLELRKRLRPYLSDTLEISEKYGMDPYWVLAVMWTESHYVHSVKSHKNATGLMQVLPSTAETVFEEPISGEELLREPSKNIEVGVLYLKKLLSIYSYNYQKATVAYNQGPGNVKKKGPKVMENNQYLIKVDRAYQVLTGKTKKYLAKTTPPYKATFVVAKKQSRIKRPKINLKTIFENLVFSPPKKEKNSEKRYF